MRLSGHSYKNEVFESLLNGLGGDVIVKKRASEAANNPTPINPWDVFTTTTQHTLESIREDELDMIAKELQFAADKSKIAVNMNDLSKFAAEVKNRGFRGKNIERAARKYCSELQRDIAEPSGTTKLGGGSELIDQLASHRIHSATCDPDEGITDSKTGGYMGMMRNPNSIWDSGALQRLAQIPTGDEKIRASQEEKKQFKLDQKQAFWQAMQDKHSDPNQLHKGVSNAGTSPAHLAGEVVNQKLPENSMSIFSDDHDFGNIPQKTLGETIGIDTEQRHNKKAEAKAEWNKLEPAKKVRSDIDRLFDGLAG